MAFAPYVKLADSISGTNVFIELQTCEVIFTPVTDDVSVHTYKNVRHIKKSKHH